jgi:hypothetical protein
MNTGESRLLGGEYTEESKVPEGEYTGVSILPPGSEYTGVTFKVEKLLGYCMKIKNCFLGSLMGPREAV